MNLLPMELPKTEKEENAKAVIEDGTKVVRALWAIIRGYAEKKKPRVEIVGRCTFSDEYHWSKPVTPGFDRDGSPSAEQKRAWEQLAGR